MNNSQVQSGVLVPVRLKLRPCHCRPHPSLVDFDGPPGRRGDLVCRPAPFGGAGLDLQGILIKCLRELIRRPAGLFVTLPAPRGDRFIDSNPGGREHRIPRFGMPQHVFEARKRYRMPANPDHLRRRLLPFGVRAEPNDGLRAGRKFTRLRLDYPRFHDFEECRRYSVVPDKIRFHSRIDIKIMAGNPALT